MKLKTHTLGCKVNQYETEFVREGLASVGYQDVREGEEADLCVVNTCTVTAEGDSKSRQVIRRLARDNPAAKIVVMGCYATRAPEEVAALPNVTEVLTDKRELPDLLGRFGVTDVPTGVSAFGERHRAYVKVQDGCMLRCSFCIIPHVRPQLTSRPVEHIVHEVRRLIDNGYREVVLTGIHLGHYGVEWNRDLPKERWTRLAHLVERLAELPGVGPNGDWRLRLSSIEATEVTRELIDVMADHPERVAPHLHISMQSGSDSVLRRMRRRWGAKRFVDRCNLLRERLDQPAITTDVIVGFPGETDAEFAETVDVCRQARFSKIHLFPVQRPTRHSGRHDARSAAGRPQEAAAARVGASRGGTAGQVLPQPVRQAAQGAGRDAACRWLDDRHLLPLRPCDCKERNNWRVRRSHRGERAGRQDPGKRDKTSGQHKWQGCPITCVFALNYPRTTQP